MISSTNPCKTDSDCPLSGQLKGFCDCGLNTDGEAFCRAMPGDVEFIDYAAAFQRVIAINQQCHSESSYDRRCPSIANTPELQDMLDKLNIYIYRPSFINAPQCIQSVTNISYTEYKTSTDVSGSSDDPNVLSIIVGCVIGVILLILMLAILAIVIRRQSSHQTSH